ncbi:MAG: HD domain-containing protein [Snowella sp.]|nr:HD domain-containing protein [Snowella sp.]
MGQFVPNPLSSRFDQALIVAAELHRHQFRKSSQTPYLAHLLAVSSLVLEYGGNETEAIAGLLHDAVEDQGGLPTLEKIRAEFGEEVANIVEGCTDAYTIPKPPWKERKLAYIVHLANASASVKLVSCADKLHNARSILMDYRQLGDELWSRFAGGKDGTLWYYRAIADTLQAVNPNPIVAELDRVVTEIEHLANLSA